LEAQYAARLTLYGGFVAHVDFGRNRVARARRHRLLRGGQIDVSGDDLASRLGEQGRSRAADSRSGAGDHRHSARGLDTSQMTP